MSLEDKIIFVAVVIFIVIAGFMYAGETAHFFEAMVGIGLGAGLGRWVGKKVK